MTEGDSKTSIPHNITILVKNKMGCWWLLEVSVTSIRWILSADTLSEKSTEKKMMMFDRHDFYVPQMKC